MILPTLIAARVIENFETCAAFELQSQICGTLANRNLHHDAGEELQGFLLCVQCCWKSKFLFMISMPETNVTFGKNPPRAADI